LEYSTSLRKVERKRNRELEDLDIENILMDTRRGLKQPKESEPITTNDNLFLRRSTRKILK